MMRSEPSGKTWRMRKDKPHIRFTYWYIYIPGPPDVIYILYTFGTLARNAPQECAYARKGAECTKRARLDMRGHEASISKETIEASVEQAACVRHQMISSLLVGRMC